MRLVALSLLAFLAFAGSAEAQGVNTNCGSGQTGISQWAPCRSASFVAAGYQQITSITVATTLTIPAGSMLAVICVEAQGIRYRDDGTAPTASVGMPVASGTCFQYAASNSAGSVLAAMQVIQQTSGAIVNVSYYK